MNIGIKIKINLIDKEDIISNISEAYSGWTIFKMWSTINLLNLSKCNPSKDDFLRP